MELTLDILQGLVNVGAASVAAVLILGRIFPDEKVSAAAFKAGAALSKWGIRALNVASWNAIETHIIRVFDTVNSGFGAGLRSDNKE